MGPAGGADEQHPHLLALRAAASVLLNRLLRSCLRVCSASVSIPQRFHAGRSLPRWMTSRRRRGELDDAMGSTIRWLRRDAGRLIAATDQAAPTRKRLRAADCVGTMGDMPDSPFDA